MTRRVSIAAVLFALAASAAAPKRVISLSPNLTEILYGIGAFGDLVAVSDYCTYPPEVKKLPSIGGWATPDLEKIAAFRPDLVLVDDAMAPFVRDNFAKLGLKLLVVPNHTVDDVYAGMTALGEATGHREEATRLAARTREGLRQAAQKTAGLPKRSVVMIVDRVPGSLRDLYTVTDGSFLAQLVEIAGGRLAVAPNRSGYAKLSKEDLLAADPDVIFDFAVMAGGRFSADPIEAWKEMPQLKAVREHHVYPVNEDYVPHNSQRIVETAALFARLIHPEAK